MNRRSFFQRIACAVVGVTAAVYAPGLLKAAGPRGWLGVDVAGGPDSFVLGSYWFEARGTGKDPVLWTTTAVSESYRRLTGWSER